MEKGGSWLERKALKVLSWGPSTSLFGACHYLGPSLYQDGLQRALRGRSPVPVPGSLSAWGDRGGGWGGAATGAAASLLSLQHFTGEGAQEQGAGQSGQISSHTDLCSR